MAKIDFESRRKIRNNPDLYPAVSEATDTVLPLDPDITPRFQLSRLMVVAIVPTGDSLGYRSQTEPNGPWEPGFTIIDKDAGYGKLAAGSTQGGCVAIVAQTISEPSLYYFEERPDHTRDGVFWHKPVALGNPTDKAGFSNLALESDSLGLVEIFGLDHQGQIWMIHQNPDRVVTKTIEVTPPGHDKPIKVTVQEKEPPLEPWSKWQKLAETTAPFAEMIAINNADNRIALFALLKTGALVFCEQKETGSDAIGNWTAWRELRSNGPRKFANLCGGLDRQGAINIFTTDSRGDVVHTRQVPSGADTWGPWAYPGLLSQNVSGLIAGLDCDANLGLVALTGDTLHASLQLDAAFAQWNGWITMARVENGAEAGHAPLAMNYNADGRLALFYSDPKTGALAVKCQIALNSTEWEAEWTEINSKDMFNFAVVRDLTPTDGSVDR